LRFGVWGLGFGVEGLGLRRVQGLVSRVEGLGFKAPSFWLRLKV